MKQRGRSRREAEQVEVRRTRQGGRTIELFHVAFLEVATAPNGLPLEQFVIKGGANLRFFYGSARRSVDMDFDYVGAAARADAFADRVDAIFASAALAALLRLRGIQLRDLRRHKQSPTTRRWKFSLDAEDVSGDPSKVEFSGRVAEGGHAEDHALAAIDADLARRLRARQVRLLRYGPRAAIAQKIGALRLRRHTEPRDVFDLAHLLREFPDALGEVNVSPDQVQAARDRSLELRYDDYVEAVVPYLQEDLVELYRSEEAWSDMQLRVAQQLESRLGARQ